MKPPASVPANRPNRAPRAALGCLAMSLSLCLVSAAQAADAPAEAPDPTMAEIVGLNKKAIAAYRAGKAQAAMDDLLTAAKLAAAHDLGQHDVMARTQIHLGIIAIAGLKDRYRGLAHFGRALAIRPDIKLTPSLSSPKLVKDLRAGRRVDPQPHESAIGPELTAPGAATAAAPAAEPKPQKEPAQAQARTRSSDNPHEPPLPQVGFRRFHTLCPFRTQESPSRTARVRTAARSEPASVSENS